MNLCKFCKKSIKPLTYHWESPCVYCDEVMCFDSRITHLIKCPKCDTNMCTNSLDMHIEGGCQLFKDTECHLCNKKVKYKDLYHHYETKCSLCNSKICAKDSDHTKSCKKVIK